jgi:hypothetical protein
MDYVRASSLLATGNIRGGKALMINRNFLEDRYFSGSLTRFYRDTVSVQDVLGGMSHGAAVPYFRPGSLTTNTSSLSYSRIRSADPFGAVAQPFGGSSSPFQVTYSAPVTVGPVFYRAQFPAQYDFGVLGSEISPEAMNYYSMTAALSPSRAPATDLGELDGYYSTPWARAAETPDWMTATTPAPLSLTTPPLGPDHMLSLRAPTPEAGPPLPYGQTAPMPGSEAGAPTPAPPSHENDDPPLPSDLTLQLQPPATEPGVFESGQPTEYLFPRQAAEILLAPGRPRRLDEQYHRLGLLDLEAGAYTQAAEAFRQSAAMDFRRSRQAGQYEGWSWLLAGQFFRAANLLERSVTENPDGIDPSLRLTSVVSRVEDWQASEEALEAILSERPDSAPHAFLLAYLRIFLGRPQGAADLLTVAEKHPDYAPAARLLRDKALR